VLYERTGRRGGDGLRVICAINYHLATVGLASHALTASIYKAEKFSDHAPLTIECDFTL